MTRLARTLAAACLAGGLTATLVPAAQAAPTAGDGPGSEATVTKARTKLDLRTTETTVTRDDFVTFSGTLERRHKGEWHAYANRKVYFMWQTDGRDPVQDVVKTTAKGKFTFKITMIGAEDGARECFYVKAKATKKAKATRTRTVCVTLKD